LSWIDQIATDRTCRQDRHVELGTWTATGIAAASFVVACAAFVRTGRWREQERQAAEPRLEVMARPWYTHGGPTGIVLERVQVIAHNTSVSTPITVTRFGIEPLEAAGPLRVFGGGQDVTVQPGTSLYRDIPASAFTELLETFSKQAEELTFLIYVRTGHGSATRSWTSTPFSVAPSDPPRTPDGGLYSSWVG
jgi:hypothetical protein